MDKRALKTQVIEGFLEMLKDVADPAFQEDAWLKKIPTYWRGFEDLRADFMEYGYHEVFDNYEQFGLTENQVKILQQFYKEYDEYSYRKYDENIKEILADPKWHKIRQFAQKVIDEFNKNPGWKNPP